MMPRSSSHLDHLGLHVVALPQTRAACAEIPDPPTSFAACDNERKFYVCRSSTVHIGVVITYVVGRGGGPGVITPPPPPLHPLIDVHSGHIFLKIQIISINQSTTVTCS